MAPRFPLTHIAIAVGIGIVLLGLTLLTHALLTTPVRDKTVMVNTPKSKPVTPVGGHLQTATPASHIGDFQDSDFYRTIIDNNLFRPLGWTPPRPKEPYRLLGTLIPKDGKSPPNAIIQTTAGNKTYIVSTGDKLDKDTTLTDIQAKQVTLEKAGQQRTLKFNPSVWLK